MTSLKHKLSTTLGTPRVEPRKELLRQLHFLIHKMGRQHYLFAKGLLVTNGTLCTNIIARGRNYSSMNSNVRFQLSFQDYGYLWDRVK